MSVPFVGIWKPARAVPLPYHIQMHNPAATHTAHAEQKGSRLIIVLYGKACLHSWLYSYHGLCKPHSWLHYNRWLEHSFFNKFPHWAALLIMGSKNHSIVSHNHHYTTSSSGTSWYDCVKRSHLCCGSCLCTLSASNTV